MFAERHLETLELPKILEQLAKHCTFSLGATLARALRPSDDAATVQRWLAETQEARQALNRLGQLSLSSARDVREAVRLAARGGTLDAPTLLAIRDTLESGRAVQRAFARMDALYPHLITLVRPIAPCRAIVEAIKHALDDDGNVRDEASPQLAEIRRELRVVHDQIIARLQRMIANPAIVGFLQEALITQRSGRYVLPVKADFKGRIPGIVHDQSASGQTLFIEPLGVVDLNNQWRELQLTEEREVQRVLTALSARVGAEAEAITRTVEALAYFDLVLAKARYAEALGAAAPTLVEKPALPRLHQARHPLLNPRTAVPIDVLPGENVRALVITGPNTGGKTVALKTIGLFALMAQCGLHLPCARAELPIYTAVYADIGDEQSIEQNLSTFSAHMTNLRSFIEQTDERSLVLLDELGAGTDPAEGAALARALLEYLLGRGAWCVVATHYPELKAWAALTPGAANASVAFDAETLRPLYALSIGLPGRSNAFAIAQRLGLPAPILEAGRTYLDQNLARSEDLLAAIAGLHQQAEQALARARQAQQEAEQDRDRWRAQRDALERERAAIFEQARQEALRETEHLRAEVRRLRAQLIALGVSLEPLKSIEREVDRLVARAQQAAAPMRATVTPPLRTLQPGATVHVRSLNAIGELVALGDGEAEVQVGRARLRVKLGDLELADAPRPSAEKGEGVCLPPPPPPKIELDLRGMTAEEGVAQVERYLDRAARAGMPFVRLIHGKGTGALRRAVREALKGNRLVRAFESGTDAEGGDGVTIVYLND
ncbi:MAG: endonuclease MutS2 [Thermoflexales bacterium]|nr:endonuclease MutS2 [Thermoflexales bacterium]MCX7938540.1 endonuclease MutS2 [Thermoflexales bacterium]